MKIMMRIASEDEERAVWAQSSQTQPSALHYLRSGLSNRPWLHYGIRFFLSFGKRGSFLDTNMNNAIGVYSVRRPMRDVSFLLNNSQGTSRNHSPRGGNATLENFSWDFVPRYFRSQEYRRSVYRNRLYEVITHFDFLISVRIVWAPGCPWPTVHGWWMTPTLGRPGPRVLPRHGQQPEFLCMHRVQQSAVCNDR